MRHPQWEARLNAVVAKHMRTPHCFGKHDCILWPLAAAQAVTGKDHARGHRGKYKSFASAYAYLSKLGHDSPEAALDSLFEEKPPGFAHRGDLVMTADGIPALCMGGFAFCVGQEGSTEGLLMVPRSAWAKAWKVA
jgi:hypothetical protein